MRIIGCDLHARQQTIAMLDTDTGELVEKVLGHEGEEVREFYAALPKPVLVLSSPAVTADSAVTSSRFVWAAPA